MHALHGDDPVVHKWRQSARGATRSALHDGLFNLHRSSLRNYWLWLAHIWWTLFLKMTTLLKLLLALRLSLEDELVLLLLGEGLLRELLLG